MSMDWFKDCFPGTPPIFSTGGKHPVMCTVLLEQGPHQIPGLIRRRPLKFSFWPHGNCWVNSRTSTDLLVLHLRKGLGKLGRVETKSHQLKEKCWHPIKMGATQCHKQVYHLAMVYTTHKMVTWAWFLATARCWLGWLGFGRLEET